MVFQELVYATEFAVLVFIWNGDDAFGNCGVLELPPTFGADECVLTVAEGVICKEVGKVFFCVGNPSKDLF